MVGEQRSGGARSCAPHGGKLARVETAKPYPAEYQALTEAAKAEREADARPALKPGLPNPQDYDVIVIGHPIWSGRMPNALRGYIETHDFSGKTIAHFATHGGSGLGESDEELRSLLPRANSQRGWLSTAGAAFEISRPWASGSRKSAS